MPFPPGSMVIDRVKDFRDVEERLIQPEAATAAKGVAVTGVEVSRDDGKPLGYYINDTGTNEGGRFVAGEAIR